MKRFFAISLVGLLTACTSEQPLEFSYKNLHKLDKDLVQPNACLVINNNKTIFKKGHKNLSIDPFLGQEGYSTASVSKQNRPYDNQYENQSCKNPIELTRKIEVSSISYPSSCIHFQYAGNIYTGSTTSYNSWNDTITTDIHSRAIYNPIEYACVRTSYYIDIDFYKGNQHIGNIESGKWQNHRDMDDTINKFTRTFIDNVRQDYMDKVRQEQNKEQQQHCAACFDNSKTFFGNLRCSLRGCSPDEI